MKTNSPFPKRKHTPGPWYFRPEKPCVEAVTKGGYIMVVADCSRSYVMDDDEAKVNARLIAAAPDLLATVKQLLPFAVEHYRKSTEGANAIYNARKVLEAVEGGAA